jgi:hypothetical protein
MAGYKVPASQTLIVLSAKPEAMVLRPLRKMSPDALTMVFPFGEKATDSTGQSWALSFSPLSSKDAATSTGLVRFGRKGARVSAPTRLHPRL